MPMEPVMPYSEERREMILARMRAQESDLGVLPKAKLLVKGEVKSASVYRFQLEELCFNKANGRIKAEVLDREAQLGRILDAEAKEDQVVLGELLLSIRQDENAKILEDLRENGQLQPGIVTCDGLVINGNRRKALLEKLSADTGLEKYKYLEAHVLPMEMTKRELWLIEAGIQLSAPQQLDYSPINHLLKLWEGVQAGLSIEDMAARIYGVDRGRIEDDLKRLKLIDEYLRDFMGKEGRYYLVDRLNEHFIDLQKMLQWIDSPKGRVERDWDPDASAKTEFKLAAFHYIRSKKFTHLRIREMRNLFCLKESWAELRRSLEISAGEGAAAAEGEVQEQPAGDEEFFEDEEDPEQTPTARTQQAAQDLQEEAQWQKAHESKLKRHFQDAKERQQIHQDFKQPVALAKRALRNVRAIRMDSPGFNDSRLDGLLGEIIQCVNELRAPHKKKRVRRPKKSKKSRPVGRQKARHKKGRKSKT